MITIFGDFRQFSAKKLAFFSKTNVMIKFLHNNSFVLSQKRLFFRRIFGQKYFLNRKIGIQELVRGPEVPFDRCGQACSA
jgi:hypothetical protein